MKRPIGRAVAVATLIASSLWACSTSPTQPTTSTTTTTNSSTPGVGFTETFSGTLALGGTDFYFFGVLPGTVTAKVTALGPDATVTIAVAVGSWNGLTCIPVVVNEESKLNSVLLGLATAANPLCLKVYDLGIITEQTTYTVTVTHF